MNLPELVPIANGEALSLDRIPDLAFETFRKTVIREVESGWRLVCLCADSACRGYALLADGNRHQLQVARTLFPSPAFPSMALACTQAHLFEREIAEQLGVRAEGHPWPRPVRVQDPGQGFYRVEGEGVHEVGVGPVHAGVIEPGHFRFQCHGEEVFQLEIALGYQHRGVERALVGAPRKGSFKLVETVAGDASIAHAWAHALVLEGLGKATVPMRGQLIRAVALELERLANHTGDLGAMAGDVGFLPTQSYCGRLRGDWLNLSAALCGSRLGRDLIVPGGVRFEVGPSLLEILQAGLEATSRDVEDAVELMFKTPSVLARFEDTGRIAPVMAEELGLVGPPARACGQPRDVRTEFPYGPYRDAPVPMVLDRMGDVGARARIRWKEIQASVDFLKWALEALRTLPEGPVSDACADPAGEHLAVGLTESWRGEVLHLAVTDEGGRFGLCKIVDPSFHNWNGLALAMRREGISDFPLCNKSFNLSYCGFDL